MHVSFMSFTGYLKTEIQQIHVCVFFVFLFLFLLRDVQNVFANTGVMMIFQKLK